MILSPTGRWGGRMTKKPLPTDDASLEALADDARHEVIAVWHARAASELRVATSFRIIAADLRALHADDTLVALADRGVDDEHRHHDLCVEVASRVAGARLDPPPLLDHVVPDHPGAPERLLPALHVLGHAVMNETFATAFLEASLAASRGALARAAVGELLSDEIDHARIGWGFLASIDAGTRRELAPHLVPVARANLAMWRTAERAYPVDPAVVAQGAPSLDVVEAALVEGVAGLIVPGLRRMGFELTPDDVLRVA